MASSTTALNKGKRPLQLLTLKHVQDALRTTLVNASEDEPAPDAADGPFFEACEENKWQVVSLQAGIGTVYLERSHS